jgi:NTP pyrophosphatase (non-canonical NTP hydrolase)
MDESMTFEDYMADAMRTFTRQKGEELSGPLNVATFALGLAGEAGEVADLIKKGIGHGHDVPLDKLTSELGDVLWYVAAVAKCYGLTLEEVAMYNVAKLRKRYPDGFTHQASLFRGVE